MRSDLFRRTSAVLLAVAFVVTSLPFGARAAAPDPVRGKNAMVASQHELASKIGVEVLKKGGNAVDAAIAVGIDRVKRLSLLP